MYRDDIGNLIPMTELSMFDWLYKGYHVICGPMGEEPVSCLLLPCRQPSSTVACLVHAQIDISGTPLSL